MRRVLCDDGVFEQQQAGFGAAQNTSSLTDLAVEHVAARRRDDGVRPRHEMPVRPHLFPKLVRLLIRVG
jgi:hypothetical protein